MAVTGTPVTTSDTTSGGIPTVAEVRDELFDADAEANKLLGALEFSDADITKAIQRCLNEFNAMNPPYATTYTTANWPDNWQWPLTRGAAGYAVQSAAARYVRNALNATAGGVRISTEDKGPAYAQLAQVYLVDWKTWAMETKLSLALNTPARSIAGILY